MLQATMQNENVKCCQIQKYKNRHKQKGIRTYHVLGQRYKDASFP